MFSTTMLSTFHNTNSKKKKYIIIVIKIITKKKKYENVYLVILADLLYPFKIVFHIQYYINIIEYYAQFYNHRSYS
jgi:hypothetical protein